MYCGPCGDARIILFCVLDSMYTKVSEKTCLFMTLTPMRATCSATTWKKIDFSKIEKKMQNVLNFVIRGES